MVQKTKTNQPDEPIIHFCFGVEGSAHQPLMKETQYGYPLTITEEYVATCSPPLLWSQYFFNVIDMRRESLWDHIYNPVTLNHWPEILRRWLSEPVCLLCLLALFAHSEYVGLSSLWHKCFSLVRMNEIWWHVTLSSDSLLFYVCY